MTCGSRFGPPSPPPLMLTCRVPQLLPLPPLRRPNPRVTPSLLTTHSVCRPLALPLPAPVMCPRGHRRCCWAPPVLRRPVTGGPSPSGVPPPSHLPPTRSPRRQSLTSAALCSVWPAGSLARSGAAVSGPVRTVPRLPLPPQCLPCLPCRPHWRPCGGSLVPVLVPVTRCPPLPTCHRRHPCLTVRSWVRSVSHPWWLRLLPVPRGSPC